MTPTMTLKGKRLPERWQPLALFVLLAAVFGTPTVLGLASITPDAALDADPLWGDRDLRRVPFNDLTPLHLDWPRDSYVAAGLWRGRLDHWNPLVAAGAPLWAEQGGPFFPLKLLYYLVPTHTGYMLFLLSRLVVAGLGAFALARARGLSHRAALLAGALFELSGGLVMQLPFASASATCLVPWLVWLAGMIDLSPRRLTLGVLLLASTMLAGHPGLSGVALLAFALTVGAHVFEDLVGSAREGLARAATRILGSGVALGVGLLLAAPGVLPLEELRSVGITYKDDSGGVVMYDAAIKIVGEVLGAGLWMGPGLAFARLHARYHFPTTLLAHVGVLTMLLVLSGRPRGRSMWALLVAGVVLMAPIPQSFAPRELPVIRLIFPVYHWPLVVLPLTQWAAAQTDREPATLRRRIAILLGPAAVLAGLWLAFDPSPVMNATRHVLRTPIVPVLCLLPWLAVVTLLWWSRRWRDPRRFGALVAFLAGFECLLVMLPHLVRRPSRLLGHAPPRMVARLKEELGQRWRYAGLPFLVGHPMTGMLYGLRDLRGVFALGTRRVASYPGIFREQTIYHAARKPDALARASVRYLAILEGTELEGLEGVALTDRRPGVRLYELPGARPRASVTHDVVVASGPEEANRIAAELKAADPRVVLEAASTGTPPSRVTPLPPGSPAEEVSLLAEEDPDLVEIDASLAAPGYVVLTDTYYPGWRATVDGAPAEIFPADGLFRAVRVEPGRHLVRFEYVPEAFRRGLWFFAFGAGLCVIMWAWSLRRRSPSMRA